MPWAVGKQPRSASQADADNLADKLEAMVRDAVAVIPDDASVDLIQATGTANADMYEQLLMYCGREIHISLLGNNQSTEQDANRASAVAASGVEDELRDDDADMVAEGLSQLAAYVVQVNWPSSMAPAYEFWEQEEVNESQVKRDEGLTKCGVKLTRSYWMRTYNLQEDDIAADVPGDVSAGTPGQDTSIALAEGDIPPDQAALDEAMAELPADELQAAMELMLRPALDAIDQAGTPEDVMVALAEAFPKLDSSTLEKLLEKAFFVADVVGRHGVNSEAKA